MSLLFSNDDGDVTVYHSSINNRFINGRKSPKLADKAEKKKKNPESLKILSKSRSGKVKILKKVVSDENKQISET